MSASAADNCLLAALRLHLVHAHEDAEIALSNARASLDSVMDVAAYDACDPNLSSIVLRRRGQVREWERVLARATAVLDLAQGKGDGIVRPSPSPSEGDAP